MLKNSLIGVWDALKYDRFVWRNSLRFADKIPTDMTGPEKRRLYDLVKENRPRVIVEIGSYLGASTCFMARALKQHQHQGTLHAVDTWHNDAMPEGNRDTFEAFSHNTARLGATVQKIRSTSVEAAAEFCLPVEMLFIDGDHCYEGVRDDWRHWSKHLTGEAIVVMHDSGWAEGVQRVIEEEIRPRLGTEGSLPNLFWGKLKPGVPC